LGVAEIASGNLLIAEEWLTKALQVEPKNRWALRERCIRGVALRNLGACLMKQSRFEEARTTLQACLQVAPSDVAALVGLGEALEALGAGGEADTAYRTAVKFGGPDHIIDIAKDRLTKMAETKLRSDAKFRPDALEFIKDALDRFSKMTPQEIQALAYEIAALGTKGFSINDPSKKYTLTKLAGEFTGLQLVSIMYAAFQQFSPGQDVGIDLSEEYAVAVGKKRE
jgi:tetratricopeptide (TPR) repeat protein